MLCVSKGKGGSYDADVVEKRDDARVGGYF